MTERKSPGKPQHPNPGSSYVLTFAESTHRLGVKRSTRLTSRSTNTSANTVVTPPKAAVAAPNARQDEVQRRRYPFNDMLKRKSGGAGDLSRDNAPSGPSDEGFGKSEMLSSGDNAVDTRMAHKIADLERALAIAKEEQGLAREELSRSRSCRQANQDASEQVAGSNADRVPSAGSHDGRRDTEMPELAEQGHGNILRQNSELRYRLAQLQEQLASHRHNLKRPQSSGEADDLRLRLHAAEKESQDRLQQLLALKSSISSLTRMDSQVTDSELAESFSQLAHRVREWTVSNFRRSRLNLDSLPTETEDVLRTLNPQYRGSIQSTDKFALYQAVVSTSLLKVFDAPIMFGLPSRGPLAALRSFAEHTQHLGTVYWEWVRSTIQVIERGEANGDIEIEKEASLHRFTGEISHILFTLTSMSLSPSAQTTLAGILKDAVDLQRTLALQKARYQLLFFRYQDDCMKFDDLTMEAVNDVDPVMGDGTDMDVDRTFLFCAFPGLIKHGDEWGEQIEMKNVLLKARVCSGVS